LISFKEKDQQISTLKDGLKKREDEVKNIREKLDHSHSSYEDLQKSSSGGRAEWQQEKSQFLSEIGNKEDQIKKLQFQLKDKEELSDTLNQRDKEINHLQEQLKEKLAVFTSEKDSLNSQLQRKDEDIKIYRNQINEKQSIVDQFEHTLKSRDLSLQEKDNTLRQMKEVLSEKEKRIGALIEIGEQTSKPSASGSGDALENAERKLKESLLRELRKEEEINTKALDISNLRAQLDQLELHYDEEKRKVEKGKESNATKDAEANEQILHLKHIIEELEEKLSSVASLPPPPAFEDMSGPPSMGDFFWR